MKRKILDFRHSNDPDSPHRSNIKKVPKGRQSSRKNISQTYLVDNFEPSLRIGFLMALLTRSMILVLFFFLLITHSHSHSLTLSHSSITRHMFGSKCVADRESDI